jgi:proteasomal ATPase-associated factor 1
MTIILPQIAIQHDFQTVIAEVKEGIIPQESFWVSCYKESSVHGRVNVRRALGEVQLIPEAIEFEKSPHVRLINNQFASINLVERIGCI